MDLIIDQAYNVIGLLKFIVGNSFLSEYLTFFAYNRYKH